MSGRRIFVTGGAGYLGSTLVQALSLRMKAREFEFVAASDDALHDGRITLGHPAEREESALDATLVEQVEQP